MPAFLASFRLEPYLWEEGGGGIHKKRRENVKKEDSKKQSREGERASQQSRKQTIKRERHSETESERLGQINDQNTNETMREGAYQAEIVCARKSQKQTQAMEKER